MLQPFEVINLTDKTGNPTGGYVRGKGLKIDWQDGPLNKVSEKGAFVETVIAACIERLRFFQTAFDGWFACRQNALAITKLEEALHWLDARTKERQTRGVEGTHQP